VSIYPGTPQQAGEFVQKGDVKQTPRNPLLVDAHKQAAYAYNVLTPDRKEARPSTFIIDKDGMIRWSYIGKNAGDRPDVDTVLAQATKAANAPNVKP
jgi:peroxiredoxin